METKRSSLINNGVVPSNKRTEKLLSKENSKACLKKGSDQGKIYSEAWRISDDFPRQILRNFRKVLLKFNSFLTQVKYSCKAKEEGSLQGERVWGAPGEERRKLHCLIEHFGQHSGS